MGAPSIQKLEASLPDHQYAPHFFVIQNGKRYQEWAADDHMESYKVMMSASRHFEGEPFLVYGEEHTGSNEPHRWHFHLITTDTPASDFWSKTVFLWRMTFGGTRLNDDELARRVDHFRELFNS